MSDEQLQKAWEDYQAEMMQIAAEKAAVLQVDALSADQRKVNMLKKRLGLI